MSVIHSGDTGTGITTVDIGDNIANALMLDSASSQYLSRTVTTSATWTLSVWVKRGKLSAAMGVLEGAGFLFNAGDTITAGALTTTALFRDPSSHFHVHISNGGLYINGVSFGAVTTGVLTDPDIGRNSTSYFDGYLSNLIFVDGTSVAYTEFGRVSADTGQWVNKTYTGAYGAKGFKLDFSNSGALGTDSSGNGNNWTLNSITSANQYTDTPTNNSCVLSSLGYKTILPDTLSIGNTKIVGSSTNGASGTQGSAGKFYFEVVISGTQATNQIIGVIHNDGASGGSQIYLDTGAWGFYPYSVAPATDRAGVLNNGVAMPLAPWTTGTSYTMMIACDPVNGKLWVGKNGTWEGDPSAGTGNTLSPPSGKTYFPMINPAAATSNVSVANFGAKAFTYTPPTGFLALNTANLPTPTIIKPSLHFNAKTRTGTGAAFNVTGQSFQPDLVESKSRSAATDWAYYDSVRGVQKQLESNTTSAETTEATGLTAFNADGFSGGALAQLNTNTASYIDYMWKMGGAAVSNTSGSITSSVSANTLAGQSVVKIAAGTAANATVGHGLSSAPELIIAKAFSQVTEWPVFCSKIANTEYLVLNTTAAKAAGATYWNSTSPTSTVFSLGSSTNTNNTNGMEFLCFHSVEGYSKVFSYTGNAAADGPFVYCGFKPRYILWKRSDSTGDWIVHDTLRSVYNPDDTNLLANTAAAESVGSGYPTDETASGFKVRGTSANQNASGATYIGIAFSEAPTKYSTAR